MPALIACYLGVFSVIPCVGLPLAIAAVGGIEMAIHCGLTCTFPCVGLLLSIAAVVSGIIGRWAVEYTEGKGKVHAWIGITGGGLFTLIYLALAILHVMTLGLTGGSR
jgi:hypothetical protein